MENKAIVSALIGLVGAMNNNGKTDNTDEVIMNAILHPQDELTIEMIHKEKYSIAPNCATCKSPCGNTSDYDISKWDNIAPETLADKEKLYFVLKERLFELEKDGQTQVSESIYRAIAYLGYDLDSETYRKAMEEVKNG